MKSQDATLTVMALASIFGLSSLNGQGNATAPPTGTVQVAVFGPFGEKVPRPEVHIFTPDRKEEIPQMGKSLTFPDVPYGVYLISAWDLGGAVGGREVIVNATETWVRVGLAFPAGSRRGPGGSLSIRGDIRPVPPKRDDWWVRVEGVFLHASREAEVLDGGRFAVNGLEMGTYLVEVFEGSKLRHIETVEIDTKQPTIHLIVSLRDSQKSQTH